MFFLFDPAIRALLQKWFSDVAEMWCFQYLSLLPAHWFARHCMIWKVAADDKMLEKDGQSIPSSSQARLETWVADVSLIFPDACSLNFVHPGPKKHLWPFWLVQTDTNTWHMDPRNVSMWSSCCWSSARRRYHSGKFEARKACCHRSPLWTPGRWKPLVEYQCNLFLMVPRSWFDVSTKDSRKSWKSDVIFREKVCKRSWPKHAKTWWFPTHWVLPSKRAKMNLSKSWILTRRYQHIYPTIQ